MMGGFILHWADGKARLECIVFYRLISFFSFPLLVGAEVVYGSFSTCFWGDFL